MKQSTPRTRLSRRPIFRKVLVVWKKTYLMEVCEQNDQRVLDLIKAGHPSVSKVVLSHEEHRTSLDAVCAELARRGIEYTSVNRDQMENELQSGAYDLVVTVGGDGTVLDVSHYINDATPVLGINSALSSSHGHFCLGNINNLSDVFDQVLSGQRKALRVLRLALTLDGKSLPLVLNEVLIAHPDIGATSRYLVRIGKVSEEHKSDGLFFGTPGGCTGWMRSYGAQLLPITRRSAQFLTRGLIVPPATKYKLVNGIVPASRLNVTVYSEMPEGRLWIDGRHIKYDFPRGCELTISPAQHDLRLFADATVNERYES